MELETVLGSTTGIVLERQGDFDCSPILTDDQSLPQAAYMAQLDRLAEQLNNGELLLADFNDAFMIQKLVEDGLRNSKELRSLTCS